MGTEEHGGLTGMVTSLREWADGSMAGGLGAMAGSGLTKVRLEVAVRARLAAGGRVMLEPVMGSVEGAEGAGLHRIVLEWAEEVDRVGRAGKAAEPAAGLGVAAGGDGTARRESVGKGSGSGGDEATLRRRLELVLGGPPGFTTGARADILADLLGEFPASRLVEVLRREWVQEFDTGAEASASVGGGAA